VFIGGGYELAQPGTEGDRHPSTVEQLKRAYGLLGYDIFLLSPTDAVLLKNTKTQIPRGWQAPLDEPLLVERNVPGGRLAFVLFPDAGRPDPAMERRLAGFARDLRAKERYNLVMGVSTWGAERESAFIEEAEPVFDIILGSGDGPGYSGLYLRDNRVLWVRAFTKGKSVHSVTVPVLPAPGEKAVWSPEQNVRTVVRALGDDVAPVPEIQGIFAP
jgi:hypothetical protein